MIADAGHRPWPPPDRPWVMAQTWHDLLFAHWPVRVERVRAVVPSPIEIDTYDGHAWLGIVPFRMTGVRLRWLPAIPGLSAFPELNVRTYVTLGGKPGIYFFSLDAANRAAVVAAQRWFHLPYFHARMSSFWDGLAVRYSSRRMQRECPPGELKARYGPIGKVFRAERESLEHWLTERYCLYAVDSHGTIYRGEIHHLPWPLQRAEVEFQINTMTEPHGIRLPRTPELLHFARHLDVIVWPVQRVR